MSAIPGFETVSRKEMDRFSLSGEVAAVRAEKGGITFRGRLHDGYSLNLNLATANRILLRIHHFRATNFRQLTKQLVAIDWELYLPPGCPFSVRVALHHSRIYHSGAVQDLAARIVQTALKKYAQANIQTTGSRVGIPQCIYIRGEHDRFLVSLDSSGENLHKRGLRKSGGKAPIRETIAAAVLQLAGYTGEQVLMDPMCGSGTFSLEAARMARATPPGWFRSFSFQDWPAFQPGRWQDIRRTAEQKIVPQPKAAIFASDRSRKGCHLLKQTLLAADMRPGVDIRPGDFFSIDPQKVSPEPGVVVINPPYGIRLGNRQSAGRFYYQVVAKLDADYRGWTAAIIAPDRKLARNTPFADRLYPFSSGGLKLTLVVGRIG